MKNSKLKLEDFLGDSLNNKQAFFILGGTGASGTPPPLDPPPSGGKDGEPIGPTPTEIDTILGT
jgi:hypothetical protein